jgi:hypothetical protein
VDFLALEATHASFMVDPETLTVNENEPRKSDRFMLTLTDEACLNRLNSTEVRFEPTIQICSLHETPKATLDSQPVNVSFLLFFEMFVRNDKVFVV